MGGPTPSPSLYPPHLPQDCKHVLSSCSVAKAAVLSFPRVNASTMAAALLQLRVCDSECSVLGQPMPPPPFSRTTCRQNANIQELLTEEAVCVRCAPGMRGVSLRAQTPPTRAVPRAIRDSRAWGPKYGSSCVGHVSSPCFWEFHAARVMVWCFVLPRDGSGVVLVGRVAIFWCALGFSRKGSPLPMMAATFSSVCCLTKSMIPTQI